MSSQGTDGAAQSELSITVSLFSAAVATGPAYGKMQRTTWAQFAATFKNRREGSKDGPCFVGGTFTPEPNGQVRRLIKNIVARTIVALDCETDKTTGEVPPSVDVVVDRIKRQGWAAAVYTSHNHTVDAPRYRIVIPLSEEIASNLPAVEVVAEQLDVLGILDMGKVGLASVFYMPSSEPGCLAGHQCVVIEGAPIAATWIRDVAGAVLDAREVEQERLRTAAMQEAVKRRNERIAAGFDPTGSIIEAVRQRLDLKGELLSHGYRPVGDKFLYSQSATGVPGVHILSGSDGVQRVYSHHSGDPLSPGNLPPWCQTAKAVDVVDVVTILDFDSDRKKALRTLAKRFGIESSKKSTVASPTTVKTSSEATSLTSVVLERPDPEQVTNGTRDIWRDGLIYSKSGNPQPNVANAITALRNAPEWEGILWFDQFQVKTIIRKPLPWKPHWNGDEEWTDTHDIRAANWLQHQGINVGPKTVAESVEAVSKDRPFHPVIDYLNRCQWDGEFRLDRWAVDYLGAIDSPYILAVSSKWMISAVARIFEPGIKADCALILEGPQGIRKSTAVQALGSPWYTDDISELGSKDAKMENAGVWIIELAELDAMGRAEINKIKAFMSRRTDRFRPAYGRRVAAFGRQCVFVGTVNHNDYLRDDTGGRRFWPVTCTNIDVDGLARVRDQLWAEARVRYMAGEPHWIDDKSIEADAKIEQQARYQEDVWKSPIMDYLSNQLLTDEVEIGAILANALNLPKERWTRADQMRIASCLKTLGWERVRRTIKEERRWFYSRPVPKSTDVPT